MTPLTCLRLKNTITAWVAALLIAPAALASPDPEEVPPGFFRYPHTDGTWIVFTSEGDLWKVGLEGGTAVRLTTHRGEERFAHFSPDGRWIAYSGQEDGQDDVYVIPASGGEPRRLTYHPDRDQVLGWDPEGNVLFRSSRETSDRIYHIFTVPPDGGWPGSIGLDKGTLISYEPGGSRIAFNRYSREFRTWKRYRGGWAQDIWVGNLKSLEFRNITDNPPMNDWDGTDAFPMWHRGGRIYFLSDRDGRSNIYSMLPDGSNPKRHTGHDKFDIRWPSLCGDVIVYQHGMDIRAYNISSGKTRVVPITLPTDRVQARTKFIDPKRFITDFELSPDGKRVLFCSRGELFTVPARGEGLVRQLTFSSGIREKFPSYSPDGIRVAAWSDATGEEQLYLYPANGGNPTLLGTDNRTWHFPPVWSPDGTRLVFGNQERELVVMEVESGKTAVIDRSEWEVSQYAWSPDSRYLAYVREENNHNKAIGIWDARSGAVHPVTDCSFSSYDPVFDPEGKYLFFLSDRYANPYLDRDEFVYILDRRTRPYALSLKPDTPSPFAPQVDPQQDEEKEWGKWMGKGKRGKGPGKEEEEKEPVKVEIDFDGLPDRIIPVPVPAGNYGALHAVEGKLFYLSWNNRGMLGVGLFEDKPEGRFKLHRFNIRKKKDKVVAKGILGYDISQDGKKLLVHKKDEFIVQGIDEESEWRKMEEEEEEDRRVDLSQWDLRVDVRAEWRQMFVESWRLQRDFFWDPNMHGVDWVAVRAKYEPLAARISTRDELNDLIGEMFAELNCSHAYVWGGDQRRPEQHTTGMLGVDVTRDPSGFYRIERVIRGRPWNPELASPLSAPAIDAREGEYIISINGRPTSDVDNYLELLLDKADKVTSITLNDRPSLKGSREVIIKPLSTERIMRYIDWVDSRQAYVEARSGGKIGYIHLANMMGLGLSQFAAGYRPQHNKPALIMDVRFNGGGFVAEMILSHLARRMWSTEIWRSGTTGRRPWTAFHGHMAAVCNGETGSDGETFTEGFKRLGLGPVIGTRTWGGWVGIRGDKRLMDRGMVTQPEATGWGFDRQWLIEGHGTDPDMVVVNEPAAMIRGDDPQLDATIKYLLEKLESEPMEIPPPPPYPDRSIVR